MELRAATDRGWFASVLRAASSSYAWESLRRLLRQLRVCVEASRVDFAKSKFHALPLAISISGGGINEVSDGVCKIRDACSNREVIETLWQALLSRTASATAKSGKGEQSLAPR